MPPGRPKTGIKDGFEEMQHEFPFGVFHSEKQDYLFMFSVALGNVRWEGPKSKLCFIYFQTRISRKIFLNGN